MIVCNNYLEIFWVTDTEGKECAFEGLLCGGVTVGLVDLTDYIREHIPINGLFVFDEYEECKTDS